MPPSENGETHDSTGAAVKPWILAVTGGIGSGKSTVAEIFASFGAHVIDADLLAHEVLMQSEVISEIEKVLGEGISTPDGSLDHAAISELVFANEQARADLEKIVHPQVRKRIDVALAKVANIGFDSGSPLPCGRPLILLDIPLLEGSPYRKLVDRVLFIEAPEEDREQRLQQHRGWKPGERALRESAQVPLSEKKETADGVISNRNETSAEEIQQQCRSFLEQWMGHREGEPE
ncbi:MAG: dephospho-CoA kinase [Planctomycetota bacterium]